MLETPEAANIQKPHNRLLHEKSPYLLQHAYNPVDWYPWSDEAFAKARVENKPIFLSIGYSTCHWCHVMEKESFENSEVSRLLNDTMVCIKVDREERPDIDSSYMTICQLMTGSGGWPLTVIMTPDKAPFYIGTYIPKQNRFGRIGMLELIPRIRELWNGEQQKLVQQAEQLTAALRGAQKEPAGEEIGLQALENCYAQLEASFDPQNGGFSNAPKFPTPHHLTFLLRYWKRSGNEKALAMVEHTLQRMRQGGVYDQIGLGFHRYSTDERWFLPHFEKMLYDQGMLAIAYTEAFQVTHNNFYLQTTQEILTYVLRDMTDQEGGFYSAEDADSEGEEGKFYLWSDQEIKAAIQPDDANLAIRVFNIKQRGNYTEEATGNSTGRNILHLNKSIGAIADDLHLSEDELQDHIERIREQLFQERENRVHPLKDDKILTDWNGLMIAALAKAAQAFREPRYADAAKRAVDFIFANMQISTDEGVPIPIPTPSQGYYPSSVERRLYHRYRDGETAVPAMLDDYAFLTWGLIELYEATFEVQYLQLALEVNSVLLTHFWDNENSGFFQTAEDTENVLVRNKDIYDGAIPSGNSIAMLNLLRLARLTGQTRLEEQAVEMSRAFSKVVSQHPTAYTQLLNAVDFALGPAFEVVIAGNSQHLDTGALLHGINEKFIPNKVILLYPTEEVDPPIQNLASYIKDFKSIHGKATAYICQNFQCQPPTTDTDEALKALDSHT